jgi:hypothetical protein
MGLDNNIDWSRLDRALQKAHERFRVAVEEEDFQGVGLLCREVLVSLARIVYDESRHKTVDNVHPSETDAKRRLEAFFVAELPGSTNQASLRHARAAVSLADALVHSRTANSIDAALCLEATTSVVNLASILTGRTEKERALPAALGPFRIPKMRDKILKEVIDHYKAQGEEPALPLLEEKEIKLLTGYRLAYFPGTQREVWVGYRSGRYEHILMLKPDREL